MLKLRDYQERAIKFCLEKRRAYLAIDVGLGKTAVALNAIANSEYPTLVLGTIEIIRNVWPEEIKKWTPWLTYKLLHGPNKKKDAAKKADIYLLNYEGIKWYYNFLIRRKVKPMNLVMDESTFMKAHNTKRFKYLNALTPMFRDMRLALSGTPSPEDDLTDLWAQYYFLDGGKTLGKKYSHFTAKYFIWDDLAQRYRIYKHARKRIYELIDPMTFRLKAKDYLDLPPIIYNQLMVELPPELKRRYDKLERDFVLDIEDGNVTAFNAASLSSKLRQFVQGAIYTEESFIKLHDVKLQMLRQLVDSGQNILCPIQFRFEYELLKKEFDNPPIIYGKTNKRMSSLYIKQWNAGKIPLLLVHPQSISHGVNLQHGGNIVTWLGLPWSYNQFYQMNGRLHRSGQQKGVVVNAILMKDTIDEIVWQSLQRKESSLKELLDAIKEKYRAKVLT